MNLTSFKRKGNLPKKIILSLREKKHLSNIPRSNGLYFQLGLVAVLVIVYSLFQLQFEQKEAVIDKPVINLDLEDNNTPPDFVIEKEIPIPPLDQVNRIHIQDLTSIQIVDDDTDVLPTVIYDSSHVLERTPDITDIDVVVVEDSLEPIPISLVSDLPVYPGCEKFSDKKKQAECMSKKITQHISKEFDTDIAINYGIKGRQRISVTFVIDTQGNVINVKARAPHPQLQKEAIKVLNSLPRMRPARQGYRKVSVTYALPVIFQVE